MNRNIFVKPAVLSAMVLLIGGSAFMVLRLIHPSQIETLHGSNSSPLFEPHDKPTTIFLKTITMDSGRLSKMACIIRQSKIRTNQMKQAILAFLQGPRTGKIQVPVPEGMALNQFYFTPQGTAVVDLACAQVNAQKIGFYEETLFIRGLIDTLANNFYEVKQVRVLVNGQEVPTLAGHYALGTSDATAAVSASNPAN